MNVYQVGGKKCRVLGVLAKQLQKAGICLHPHSMAGLKMDRLS